MPARSIALPLPAHVRARLAHLDDQLNFTLVECMSRLQGEYPNADTFHRAAQEVFSDEAEACCDVENIHGVDRDQFMRRLQKLAEDAGFEVVL